MSKLLLHVWKVIAGNKRDRSSQNEVRNHVGESYPNVEKLLDTDDAFRESQFAHQAGRLLEAQTGYRRVLARAPQFAPALHFLGVAYGQLGDFLEAERLIRQSIHIYETPGYYCNLAWVLEQQGKPDEAAHAYRNAIRLAPTSGLAYRSLGDQLVTLKKYSEAEQVYRDVLAFDATDAEIHFKLGVILSKLSRTEEAVDAYRRALVLRPTYSDAYNNLALLLQKRGLQVEAELAFGHAVALDPDSAVIHFNFGQLMYEMQRYGEAKALLDRALALRPDLVEAYSVIGNLCKATGCYADAEAAYRQALVLNPELDWAHYNIGLLSLSQKKFSQGWEGFERRWNVPNFDSLQRPFPQEKWDGKASGSEGLLIWQEQGVGDVVLYASVIPELIARGMPLVVECETRLVPLFARSFPQTNVVARCNPPHAATMQPRWQSPFGSLCQWLRTSVQDFEPRGPYLVPDPAQLSTLRKRYRVLGNGLKVGISWRSHNETHGKKKSMSISDWDSLLALPNATFVNLQYGDCELEVAQLKRKGITVHSDCSVDPLKDLDAFAAQVAAMDLVICVSNTTAHFAGALGIPVWTLLPSGGEAVLWYWGSEGETSLWYPSMRIFRQDKAGDWASVMMRVEAALRAYDRFEDKRMERQ